MRKECSVIFSVNCVVFNFINRYAKLKTMIYHKKIRSIYVTFSVKYP